MIVGMRANGEGRIAMLKVLGYQRREGERVRSRRSRKKRRRKSERGG